MLLRTPVALKVFICMLNLACGRGQWDSGTTAASANAEAGAPCCSEQRSPGKPSKVAKVLTHALKHWFAVVYLNTLNLVCGRGQWDLGTTAALAIAKAGAPCCWEQRSPGEPSQAQKLSICGVNQQCAMEYVKRFQVLSTSRLRFRVL